MITSGGFRGEPKKVEGHDQNKIFPALCAGPVPPTFKFVLSPLAPDPTGELTALPRPSSWFKGPYF